MIQTIQTVSNYDPFDIIRKAEVVSFDIFDTAIVRPFLHHHEMYHIVEKVIKFPHFHKTRIKAEQFTRKLLICASGTKEEVTMLDIYEHIHINKQKAINTEISFDITICRQRKFIYQLYKFAINAGKKVIFTTDITYPRQAIVDILHKNGYTIYEKIYISSECNLSKHCGGMYKKILSDIHIIPRKIVHIGDSIKADIHQAKKHGFRPLHIPKPYHLLTNVLNEKKFQLRKTSLNSALFGCVSNIVFDNPQKTQITPGILIAFPMLYKLTQSILKTENNVFILNNEVNNHIFNIFEKINTKLQQNKPRVISININHLYASCVRTFEDVENFYNDLHPKTFKEFFQKCYDIHDFEDIDRIKKHWNNIEMKSLEIRKSVLKTIQHIPEQTIYNFIPHKDMQALLESLLNKNLHQFYCLNKMLTSVVKYSTKSTITGKPNAKAIINQISSLSQQEIQDTIFPQIDLFFSTLGKYSELL